MTTETFIGFDSAWADKAPGAICSITLQDGLPFAFEGPRLVNFSEALTFIAETTRQSDFVLVALDQPTLVPNGSGMRPAERVAGSVVSRLGGGVQPANRGKHGIFCDNAPIWRFLEQLSARENPTAARTAENGLFLIEVFPALALPSLVSELWLCRRGVKYNPAKSNFQAEDWRIVTGCVERFAVDKELTPLNLAAQDLALLDHPRKADQDKLDALICLMIGWIFRRHPATDTTVIGDGVNGYIVSPSTPAVREVLAQAAQLKGVPIDLLWTQDASRQYVPNEQQNLDTLPDACSTKAGPRLGAPASTGKKCPLCGHLFRGRGWGGLDAHWRAHHEAIMPYEQAREIIRAGGTPTS